MTRRAALGQLAVLMPGLAGCATRALSGLRIGTFSADVTVPLGHGMMGGAWLSRSVADPLEAHGLVLLGQGKPVAVS